MIVSLIAPAGMALLLGLAQLGWLRPLIALRLFVLLWLAAIVAAAVQAGRSYRAGDLAQSAAHATIGLLLLGSLLVSALSLRAPGIHDITTDLDRPPTYVQAVHLPANEDRDLVYPHGPADTPEIQRRAYPEVESIRLALRPEPAFEAALETAASMGWQITWSNRRMGKFEAVATSRLFRFRDDVVVRIESGPEGGATIDVRSTSRTGRSDLGANAARIRSYADALNEHVPRG